MTTSAWFSSFNESTLIAEFLLIMSLIWTITELVVYLLIIFYALNNPYVFYICILGQIHEWYNTTETNGLK